MLHLGWLRSIRPSCRLRGLLAGILNLSHDNRPNISLFLLIHVLCILGPKLGCLLAKFRGIASVYAGPIAPHDGIQFIDSIQGRGSFLEAGDTAVVHFTCRYRGLAAVSSREARTLGGNRTIAEPLEFKYGRLPAEFNKPLVRKSIIGIGAEVKS